jgi:hypothetical protein
MLGARRGLAITLGVAIAGCLSAVHGPDGNLYSTTDVGGGGGQIWQVVPG